MKTVTFILLSADRETVKQVRTIYKVVKVTPKRVFLSDMREDTLQRWLGRERINGATRIVAGFPATCFSVWASEDKVDELTLRLRQEMKTYWTDQQKAVADVLQALAKCGI